MKCHNEFVEFLLFIFWYVFSDASTWLCHIPVAEISAYVGYWIFSYLYLLMDKAGCIVITHLFSTMQDENLWKFGQTDKSCNSCRKHKPRSSTPHAEKYHQKKTKREFLIVVPCNLFWQSNQYRLRAKIYKNLSTIQMIIFLIIFLKILKMSSDDPLNWKTISGVWYLSFKCVHYQSIKYHWFLGTFTPLYGNMPYQSY